MGQQVLAMMKTIDLVNKLLEAMRSTPRVLVVDDDEKFNILFRETLEKCGCIVTVTTDTDSAVDRIRYSAMTGHPYDIIFVDLKIPPQDGPKVLRHAKKLLPKTPVIIITNYPNSQLVEEAFQYGYFGMIAKPLNFPEIEELFNKHKIQLHQHHEN